MSLLEYAVRNSNLDLINLLLKNGHVITENVLSICTIYGNISILTYLCNTSNLTCSLDNASFYGHLDIIQYLLQNNNFTYKKAFEYASKNNHLEILKLLYQKNIHINENLDLCIHLAAISGHHNVVSFLYFLGGRANEKTIEICAKKGYYDIIYFLYKLQKLRTIKAIFNSVKYKNYKITKLLII